MALRNRRSSVLVLCYLCVSPMRKLRFREEAAIDSKTSCFVCNTGQRANPTLSASFFGMKGLAPISSIISSNGELLDVEAAAFHPSC